MSPRVLGLVVVSGMLALSPTAIAQKLSPAEKTPSAATWSPPRTPDGQPDLQGIWSNATNKPFERPKELGAKEFYTPEEAAALAKKGYLGERNQQPDAHYDFSQYGMDAMQARFAQNLRTSLIVGPEGRIPPMTPEAVQRNAARGAKLKGHEFDGPENRSLTERCIIYGEVEGPPMLPPMYNNNMEIVQGPGYVAILNEMYHDTRLIPLDGRPHLAPSIRLWRGDSRGHWEGNTLVVDTTNFTGKTHFHGSSENLHVVERFTRTSKDTILYQFTVDDPSTWAKPWGAELVMGPALGEIYEFACHEGNYGMANNLSGARADEKRAAEEAVQQQTKGIQ